MGLSVDLEVFPSSAVFKVGSRDPQGSLTGFQGVLSKTGNHLFSLFSIHK